MTDRQVQAIIFPADPSSPVEVAVTDASPAGLSRAVGGGFTEKVFLGDTGAVMVVNADGKSRDDLAPNPRATRFVDDHVPGFAKVDTIHGPTLVLGTNPEDGTATDVPPAVASRVDHAGA